MDKQSFVDNICNAITKSKSSAEHETDVICEAFMRLASDIGNALPMIHGMIDNTARALRNIIVESRNKQNTPEIIFGGNGERALKLKEYSVIKDLIGNSTIPTNFLTIQKTNYIQDLVDLFKFDHLENKEEIKEIKDFLNGVRKEVSDKNYLTIKNKLSNEFPDNPNVETGIYNPNNLVNPNWKTIVLRGRLPDRKNWLDQRNISFCFIASGNGTRLWFYHPFEDQWIQNNNSFYFPELLDALKAQLQIAYANAYVIPNPLDIKEIVESNYIQDKLRYVFKGVEHIGNRYDFIDDKLYSHVHPVFNYGHFIRNESITLINVRAYKNFNFTISKKVDEPVMFEYYKTLENSDEKEILALEDIEEVHAVDLFKKMTKFLDCLYTEIYSVICIKEKASVTK